MDGEELSAQETALYDRQIRVWGVDAQKRLSKARILVSGVNGTTCEFCKNIVLAGVGSLTVIDDRAITEESLNANFLLSPDDVNSGRSLAEICCDSLMEFNPMVHVSVEKGDLVQLGEEFYDKFDAVIVSYCSVNDKKLINEKCRRSQKRVAFYSVDCRGWCGEIFVDLQEHTYEQKKSDGKCERHIQYPSFQEAISLPWKDLPRKMSKLYFAMRVIEKLEQSEGRSPGETSSSDLAAALKLRKAFCEAQSLNEAHVPTNLLERLLASGAEEFPPVCAILGGILGQEVIKAVSGKGDPLKNFFYYDVEDGKGVIEDVSPPVINSSNGQP